MRVLVAYATRHGATRGIAERVAETLRANGLDADARAARSVKDAGAYDAFVVGGAVYMFRWLGDATAFVRRNRGLLASRPTWLFSSGPVGTSRTDAQGRDLEVAGVPKGIAELATSLGARGHRVLFGAYARNQPAIGLGEHLMALMPAARNALPEGDFRDWPVIDAWATSIAAELAPIAGRPG